MLRLKITLVALALVLLATVRVEAAPCDSVDHRAFDFWIGEWTVRTPDGKVAGSNRIEREYDGCVLHERYDTSRGYRGESLNMFDAGRKLWHQTWVDTSGTLLLLEGGLCAGQMVMRGKTFAADGQATEHRITWTPNTDGTVRQLWESTDVKGAWKVLFDGLYSRK